MADNSGLVADVRKWLESGGYVLEMEVARAVAARAGHVTQGYHYTDTVTGLEREGDLAAVLVLKYGADYWHTLHLLIECKSTSAAWVCFINPAASGNGPWTAWTAFDEGCRTCEEVENAYAEIGRQVPTAYAITEKRNPKAPDNAYSAAQQVASAVVAEYGKSEGRDGHAEAPYCTGMAVPIVVTSSPLIACTLGDSGEVELEAVERVNLLVPRLDVPERDAEGVQLTVVTTSGLDALLDELDSIPERGRRWRAAARHLHLK